MRDGAVYQADGRRADELARGCDSAQRVASRFGESRKRNVNTFG